MFDSNLPVDLRRILQRHDIVSTERVVPGFSGGVVFRCRGRDAESQWSLKAWPTGTDASRVGEVHRVQTAASVAGVESVPRLDATIFSSGQHWELATWMPGSPAPPDASPDTVQRGAAEIRRFHTAVQSLGQVQQRAPAVKSRLSRLSELRQILPPTLASKDFQFSHDLDATIRLARTALSLHWASVSKRIAADLTPFQSQSMPTQYVLRDVHREHVLFSGGLVSGLIDFDAVRIDTPAADLARWVGGFLIAGDDERNETVWQSGMAGFAGENALKLAKSLHFATTWISLANWLVWLISEKRSFPAGPDRIAGRMRELTNSAVLQISGDHG